MLKKIIKRIYLREKADSQSYVAFLRKKGVSVGENVRFFSPTNTLVDMQAPWLLSIGNNVNITHGVIILTHDYSWAVLKRFNKSKGAIFGAQSPVVIGNDVFIGMNAIITRGVTIGDHVVIGAGSVVTHDCQSNSVYAGNPARRIMALDEYLAKRERCQFEEAKKMALVYKERFGTEPKQEIFSEYFMLFCRSDDAEKIPSFKAQMETGANYQETVQYMNTHKPMFDSYEAFLAECYK